MNFILSQSCTPEFLDSFDSYSDAFLAIFSITAVLEVCKIKIYDIICNYKIIITKNAAYNYLSFISPMHIFFSDRLFCDRSKKHRV